eukprot:gene8931-9108_t
MSFDAGLAPVDAVAVAAQHSGLFQQHAKLLGATAGAAGYSSSGNSDGSLHHSRQPTPEALVTDVALVVPDVAPCGHFPPSASPVPPVEAAMPPASAVAPAAMYQHQAATLATLEHQIAPPPATVAGVFEHRAVDGSSSPQATSEPEAPQPDTPRTAARKAAVGPPPSPLPPPSASEGPAAAEQYEAYLRRFAEGVTLRQRWHRLALSGKVDDIRADWEEWQHDMALRELQQQIQQQGKGGRRRRDDADVDADAPRQMGTAMGQALQQQGGGAPGAHVSQMVQMCARMFGGDSAALVQHLMTQQVAAPHAAPQQQ